MEPGSLRTWRGERPALARPLAAAVAFPIGIAAAVAFSIGIAAAVAFSIGIAAAVASSPVSYSCSSVLSRGCCSCKPTAGVAAAVSRHVCPQGGGRADQAVQPVRPGHLPDGPQEGAAGGSPRRLTAAATASCSLYPYSCSREILHTAATLSGESPCCSCMLNTCFGVAGSPTRPACPPPRR